EVFLVADFCWRNADKQKRPSKSSIATRVFQPEFPIAAATARRGLSSSCVPSGEGASQEKGPDPARAGSDPEVPLRLLLLEVAVVRRARREVLVDPLDDVLEIVVGLQRR